MKQNTTKTDNDHKETKENNQSYADVINAILLKASLKAGGIIFNDTISHLFKEYLSALLRIDQMMQHRNEILRNHRQARNFDYILAPLTLRALAAFGATIGGEIGVAVYDFIKNSVNYLSTELFDYEQEKQEKIVHAKTKNTSKKPFLQYYWDIAIRLFWEQLGKDKGKELANIEFINLCLGRDLTIRKHLFKALGKNIPGAIPQSLINANVSVATNNTNSSETLWSNTVTETSSELITDYVWEKNLQQLIASSLPSTLTRSNIVNYLTKTISSILFTGFSKQGLQKIYNSIAAIEYKLLLQQTLDATQPVSSTTYSKKNTPISPGLINYSDNKYYHAKVILNNLLSKADSNEFRLETIKQLLNDINFVFCEKKAIQNNHILIPLTLAIELQKLGYQNIIIKKNNAKISMHANNDNLITTIHAVIELLQLEQKKLTGTTLMPLHENNKGFSDKLIKRAQTVIANYEHIYQIPYSKNKPKKRR